MHQVSYWMNAKIVNIAKDIIAERTNFDTDVSLDVLLYEVREHPKLEAMTYSFRIE